ncbi:MAG: AAA family ATPase, partial [Planctomycetes bacterium]|nr:AAA family ATPase [Planctomycetota bacterium]
MSEITKEVEKQCRAFREMFESLRTEIGKVIVGHDTLVENVLICLFCGGHVLLEGVPGLGKTLLVRTLSRALSLEFRRIQFTPDLMPADIMGTNIVMEDPETGRRSFEFQRGPIFGQLILADEVNRATPKTQSAMLEAMQEHSVTSGVKMYKLDEPFMVLATQNPIEQEGTYPLPEAQLDRFFFKLLVQYSNRQELGVILDRTTRGEQAKISTVVTAEQIISFQQFVTQVAVAPHVQDYAIRLVLATHPEGEFAPEVTNRFIRIGASPRGVQALVL